MTCATLITCITHLNGLANPFVWFGGLVFRYSPSLCVGLFSSPSTNVLSLAQAYTGWVGLNRLICVGCRLDWNDHHQMQVIWLILKMVWKWVGVQPIEIPNRPDRFLPKPDPFAILLRKVKSWTHMFGNSLWNCLSPWKVARSEACSIKRHPLSSSCSSENNKKKNTI